MTDRKAKLRDLADELRERNCVDDAFVAKSFTDRLLIVDVTREGSIPVDIERELTALDLRGVDDAYGDGARSSVGAVGESTRHHFVDVRTRGTHQSYVVD